MAIEFERFGRGCSFVDDRWQVEYLGAEAAVSGVSLAGNTYAFMNAATRRLYDSERLQTELGVGSYAITPDEWNLLQFSLAFLGEAAQDTEQARLRLSLVTQQPGDLVGSLVHLTATSGSITHEETPFNMDLDAREFFRNVVVFCEGALGVGDEELTMPEVAWEARTLDVDQWKLTRMIYSGVLSFIVEKA